jgi:hypothetical protein
MLVEASSGEPVLTQVRVGAGRAFFLGADETWRWRAAPGGDVHERFWLQFVRYAAGERYAVRSERLALDVDRIALEAGATAQVKVRAPAGTPVEGLSLEVRSKETDSRVMNTAMTTADAATSRFTASIGPLPEGEYEIRLAESGTSDPAAALTLPLRVATSNERELADITGDDTVLSRLAESSGGELLRLEQLDRLGSQLGSTSRRRAASVEQQLWDSPYLFGLVVACFTAEWAARKRLGLA